MDNSFPKDVKTMRTLLSQGTGGGSSQTVTRASGSVHETELAKETGLSHRRQYPKLSVFPDGM